VRRSSRSWSDVGLSAGQLRVRRNLQRIKRELLFGTPKTARSIRTVSLPKRCVDALHAHRVTQEQERKVAGGKWKPLKHQPGGLIFTTSTGRATDPRSLNRMLTLLCARAKVRRVRVHDLRHTCASLLLAHGVDARIIMETLGHSTITMTLDTYAHVMQTTLGRRRTGWMTRWGLTTSAKKTVRRRRNPRPSDRVVRPR
jgi:integrase